MSPPFWRPRNVQSLSQNSERFEARRELPGHEARRSHSWDYGDDERQKPGSLQPAAVAQSFGIGSKPRLWSPRAWVLLSVCSGAVALAQPQEPPYVDPDASSQEAPTPLSEPAADAVPMIENPQPVVTQEGGPTPAQERAAVENQIREVSRPEAKEKGLILIDKAGQYYYRVEESPQRNAASVAVGSFGIAGGNNNAFQKVYGNSAPLAILLNWEYQFLQLPVGKVALRLGTGLVNASGNGRFENNYTENDGKTPREKFSLIGVPNNVDLVYRMHFWSKQPLIPYGFGGGDYFLFSESRSDGRKTRYAGALAAHVGVGLAFSFKWIDRLGGSRLDQEYGINNMMLSGELRQIIGLKSELDMTGQIWAFGITAEY